MTHDRGMFVSRVRLHDPQGYTPDGSMFVLPGALDWHEVPYLEPDGCAHQETMCRGCVDTWELDHEVQRPNLA